MNNKKKFKKKEMMLCPEGRSEKKGKRPNELRGNPIRSVLLLKTNKPATHPSSSDFHSVMSLNPV
jgi:hypothetical protein